MKKKNETIRTLKKVKNAISLCTKQGRNPIFILMNPTIQQSIINEEGWIYFSGGEREDENNNNITTILGLPILTCSVKDFLVIDNRHWYEQMF